MGPGNAGEPGPVKDAAVVSAVRGGSERVFEAHFARHRGELRLHCYRLLGSFDDAEDLVQETFLRAWNGRATYEGRAPLRAWLYRIATNACLDVLRRRPRRPVVHPGRHRDDEPFTEVPWLQPFPDRLLDEAAPRTDEPDAVALANETIELAYLVAIQHLSPRQRAVLVLRDVLCWPAAETATVLETSTASVNSALQRARAALREHQRPRARDVLDRGSATEEERALVQRYVEAHAAADTDAIVALLREDVRFWMPPLPTRYLGRDAVAGFFRELFEVERIGEFRLVPTRANRQPAAANYLRRPGEREFRALALDVLRVERGKLVEIVTFESRMFPVFGLPPVLD